MAVPRISGCILAGGQSLRMGQDKGLMAFSHVQLAHNTFTMAQHVASVLTPCDELLLNSNQRLNDYQALGFKVIKDVQHEVIPAQAGPLLGLLTGLKLAKYDWVLFSPCDSPLLPQDYPKRMLAALSASDGQNYAGNKAVDGKPTESKTLAYVAHDGERRQNLHVLLHRSLAAGLEQYLIQGQRKMYVWLDEIDAQLVDFSDVAGGFKNINSQADL